MKALKFVLIAAGLMSVPAVAQAEVAAVQAAAIAKRGDMVYSSDDRRIGRIDRVRGDKVGIIYRDRFVDIPVSTLTAADRGFKTSLTRAEVNKL